MKSIRSVFSGLLVIGGFIGLLSLLHAQETAASIQASALSLTATDVATFSSLSDVQMQNLVNTLAATPTLSVDALPLNGRAGTFYSLQNPNWPPLPCDTSGSDAWSLSGGAYLLNDLYFSYDAPQKQSLAKGGTMHMMDFSPPSFSESSGTNTPDDTVMPPVNYGTNLWIAQARQLSGYLVGIATNSQADVLYEIQSKQDLLQSNWLSEGFVYGSELTNWTALAVAQGNRTNLFLRIRSWIDSTGTGIPDWWWLTYFGQTTNVNANASAGGDGFSNLQKFQMGLNPTNFYSPPPPDGVYAYLDSTGTNVMVAWSPAQGPVTNYLVYRGLYNYDTGEYDYTLVGQVNASTTSFQDVGGYDPDYGDDYDYQVLAAYAGGHLSQAGYSYIYGAPPSPPASSSPVYNLHVAAQLVRNEAGHWQLMFSSIPAGVQSIALSWYAYDYFYDFGPDPATGAGYPFNAVTNIPASSLTNGIYLIPDVMTTNGLTANFVGKVAMVQPIGTNNQPGTLSPAGFLPDDAPCFVDGRQHLKQNLLFELRGATISQPVGLAEHNVWFDPFYTDIDLPADTNYVESSFFHYGVMFKAYDNFAPGYVEMDNLWPFTVNYDLHGRLYDTNYTGPTSFVWQTNLVTIPAAAVLGVSDPYWTFQFNATYVFDPATGVPITSLNSATLATVAAYTNSGSLYLQSGYHNLFGLSFATALVNVGGNTINPATGLPWVSSVVTLAPGSSVSLTNVSSFYSQTADPSLQAVSYYFAPVNTPGTALPGDTTPDQLAPLPMLPGFASTNQTGIMVASVGNPTVIGGWAKYAIQNGSSNKFAYLGQYFVTNAFLLNPDGTVTTNRAGIVSPYGDFFPTQAGMAAMITMPDTDTGVQATGLVRVISLNVDANHDGSMDFNYASPDFVSASKPFRFWVNDDADAGDYGGDGIPGQGTSADGVLQIQNTWQVHGRRDLVDFFPVCLNIGSLFQSNAVSAGISVTDTNYQFVLSHADGALRFAYTDLTPTNYMNFLQDTNESGVLASAPLTTITAGGVALTNTFLRGIATNNQSVILVEAWTNTTQPLVLTIYHGTNLIAQTSLALSISGVEQMFRHKSLLLSADDREVPDRLTDADVPNEPDTVDKNVVFVHGYNVNPASARGWQADMFKRFYWSGSHAKFYGVTWEGYDTQGSIPFFPTVTPNYQTNVIHAFQTAPLLANFIATLTNGPTVVAGHSLGNMVTLSALSDWSAPISQYFMIDAAVPIEAIDGSTAINTNMVNPNWYLYASGLWASKWFNVWSSSDARSTLTWSNRLANFGSTTVYNFYSSGEEVLRTQAGSPPGSLLTLLGAQLQQYISDQSGTFVWAWQEKLKGCMSGNSILSSDHGGWGLNENLGSGYVYFVGGIRTNIPPTVITNSVLQTNAFFDMSVDTAMFTASSSGSTYAQTNRNRILSDAIPAVTLPIGANSVSRLSQPRNPTENNFDMQANENGWPIGRGQNPAEAVNWHHSDIRVVAYTFTYKMFNQMATLGNLK